MPYQRYLIRPLQHGLDLSQPSLNAPFPYAHWPSKNFKIEQRSAQKRWGYNTAERDLGDDVEVQAIVLYQRKGGTRYTLYLTDTDLIKKDSGSATDDWTSLGSAGYTVPSNERWSWCVADDKFIFTNGDTNVQYYDGSSVADLDATYAIKARYCIEYANRLVIADHGSTRDPVGLAWSKEGDPTDWTDSTAGSRTELESKDYITGLGRVGANLIVYKRDAIVIGNRTGLATSPITFPRTRRGIGCVAPYSIVEVMGTNAFIGRNDFYVIDGDRAVSVGEKVRDRFFDIVGRTEVEKVFGFENNITSEVVWVANTSEGKLAFSWDYKIREWNIYEFGNDLTTAGKGAL